MILQKSFEYDDLVLNKYLLLLLVVLKTVVLLNISPGNHDQFLFKDSLIERSKSQHLFEI